VDGNYSWVEKKLGEAQERVKYLIVSEEKCILIPRLTLGTEIRMGFLWQGPNLQPFRNPLKVTQGTDQATQWPILSSFSHDRPLSPSLSRWPATFFRRIWFSF
jgi:hypothetical protein